MTAPATLSGSLGGVLTAFLDAHGLKAPQCRARLGRWKEDGRITVVEWATCLHLIQLECPRPALGLEIAGFMQPEHAGVLAYLALSCDNVGELVQQLLRFHPLMWQGFEVGVEERDDQVRLFWTPLQETPPALLDMARLGYETGIAGILQVLRTLCGSPQSPLAVTLLGAAPARIEPYEAFFGCPVTFSHRTSSITFSRALLQQPLGARDRVLHGLLERQASARLRAINPADRFLTGFQSALGRALDRGKPSLERVAADLAMSRATLQRRLHDRGMTFQQALDDTRFEMARMYLEDPRITLAEVAQLLSFSEQSAFTRAFRRWSGQTPRQFRARHTSSLRACDATRRPRRKSSTVGAVTR
jgi:AraC-like DNA-binding protein